MVRKRRKKTKRLSSMSVICITAIAVLNGLGISYGAWNDGLEIINSLSMGDIEPYFISENKLVENDRGEFLHTYIDGDTLTINGTVSSRYNDILFLNIGNRGTIPVDYKKLKEIENDAIIKGIEVQDDTIVHVYLNANDKNYQEQNQIQSKNEVQDEMEDEIQKESYHYFKYELIFVQKK